MCVSRRGPSAEREDFFVDLNAGLEGRAPPRGFRDANSSWGAAFTAEGGCATRVVESSASARLRDGFDVSLPVPFQTLDFEKTFSKSICSAG